MATRFEPRSPEVYRVRHGKVEIEVQAQGDGPLIVMLPSLGRDADDYGEAAQALAQAGMRVLRPAPRGVGNSTGAMTGISLHDYALDVAQVILHASAGPAIVLGHAYGNWVARATAADHPQLVRGVVVAAAASKDFDPRLRALIDRCEDASLPDETRLSALRAAFFAAGNDPLPWLKGWYPEVKRAQRAARAATRLESFWGAGTAPMLDLMARCDPFRLAHTRDENSLEFGSRVTERVVENASHALIPEQPAAVARAVMQWVQDLPA